VYRPKVFLSHSTRDDPEAAAMRHHLESFLTARGWHVLVDEDGLRGGEEWRGVLYRWIADCDAAIVLMSDRALGSAWVRREINLLLWRRALGSPLTVVPAELSPTADTGAPELRDLRELQFVPNNGTPEAFARAISERLPDLSAPIVDSSPGMRQWLVEVMSCLRPVTEKEPLQAAARALDAHNDDWNFPSVREAQQFLAHWLLGRMNSGRIHTAVEHIARPASSKLGQLVELVTPVWVDGEAARALLPGQHRTCAVLNAKLPGTATQYVRRAACCSLSYRTQPVSAVVGENLQAELLHDCEEAVRELLDVPAGLPLEDDEEPLSDQVCFLLIDPNDAPLAPVAAVVRTLLERFHWLNVIILTGEAVADRPLLDQWQLADAIVLPALAAGEERLAARMTVRLTKLHQETAS
jgi:hypothetical protein